MKSKELECSSCGTKVNRYANAFHKLCTICNSKRLDKKKALKLAKAKVAERKSKPTPTNRIKRVVDKGVKTKKQKLEVLDLMSKDEAFYKECFDACTDHKCEECGAPLPDQFEYNGTIVARWRYSHIIPKSISKALRHAVENINHLCFACHQKWDFGDKKSMKIYKKNKRKFPQFFK